MHGLEENFEVYCELLLSGNMPYGSPLDHMKKFYQKRNDLNLLFLKYEDMKKNLPDTILKCAEFLNLKNNLTEMEMEKLLEHLNFKNMQKNPAVNLEQLQLLNTDNSINKRFIRRGEIGDWKNYFTPELSEKFDRVIDEKFNGTGLEFEYE